MKIQKPNLDTVLNPLAILTDSYKISHAKFEIPDVKEIYSNFTARFDKYMKEMVGGSWDGQYVVFGTQYALLELDHLFTGGFFKKDKDVVIQEMKDLFTPYIGWDKYDHFEALHDLGYLPVKIKTLDEGVLAPIGCPFLTICNTHPDFEWLPNYLESILSCMIWKPLTVATMSRFFRLKSNKFAIETTGSVEGVEWQNHDFHVRGASGYESAGIDGVAFLLSSCGTDNLPALHFASKYYNSSNNDGLLAGSVAAGEHSVTTLGILTNQRVNGCSMEEAERLYIQYCFKQFPTGIFSYVSDSFDYWQVITKIVPSLKDEILQRDGKFVVRGDSGNPVHVIAGYKIKDVSLVQSKYRNMRILSLVEQGYEVFYFDGAYWRFIGTDDLGGKKLVEIEEHEALGTIECLYNIFGGVTNELGYKHLDEHIGMIYGDGINLDRQEEILSRLRDKGFASTNIVFGVGSYSLNLVGRDHLGMAIKATNAVVEINGEVVDAPIYKDPKTDSSKKSARGLLRVSVDDNIVTSWADNVSREDEETGGLTTMYVDGDFHKLTTVFEIRDRLWG